MPTTGSVTSPASPDAARAQRALLTTAELAKAGADLTPMPTSTASTPLPCTPNDPPLDAQFSPLAKAESGWSAHGGQYELQEEVIAYPSAATATAALAAGRHGLACPTATVSVNGHSVRYRIIGPGNITNRVGVPVDSSLAWTITTANAQIGLIATRMGARLVVVTFAAAKGADPSSLPVGSVLLTKALQKVRATY